MADNTVLNLGTGGDTIATDDLGGVKHQYVKIEYGADNSATPVSPANPLPMVINDITQTGTLAAAGATVTMTLGGQSSSSIQIAGTWVGTTEFEGTVDGINFVPINGVSASTSTPGPISSSNGVYRLTPGGLFQIRVRMVTYTAGTATITMRASAGIGGTFANQILPVTLTNGTDSVVILPSTTAATVTNPSVVVAFSPNSGLAGLQPTISMVSVTASPGNSAIALVPAPGVGLFNYITYISIMLYASSASPGSALPLGVSTTNMPSNPAYYFPTAMAIGTIDRFQAPILTAIKSASANTATTFVTPATLAASWLVNIGYYTAP
jgi:hypothetical protein